MTLWRLRLALDPLAPFATPPTSGTLFGHLCWAYRARHGQPALQAWVDRLPAEPFAISDLLPADHLPVPLLPAVPEALPQPLTREARESYEQRKKQRSRRFLPARAWREARTGATAARIAKQAADARLFKPARVPHNRIDRLSGQTPEQGGGGLWFADEFWPNGTAPQADLYVRTTLPERQLADLVRDVGETGFGADATLGRGRFALAGIEAAAWLDDAPAAGGMRRMLSLSQGFVSENMVQPRWKRTVLFGKVARSVMAEGARPWKLPLLLAEAGCTFAPADAGPYGAFLTGIHQDRPEIGHNGFHLAIPYTEAPVPEAAR
jgi:CRISPR-associated protein Csm4